MQAPSVQQAIAQVLAEADADASRAPVRVLLSTPSRFHLAGEKLTLISRWAESFAALPHPKLPPVLESAVRSRNWPLAVELSQQHLTTYPTLTAVTISMLLTEHDIAKWPCVLASTFRFGQHFGSKDPRLGSILELLHDLGLRVFDNEAARQAYEEMLPQVTVFRGTSISELESRQFGLCWSLDSIHAYMFARTVHAPGKSRMPRTPSDPPGVVLFATIDKEAIAAVARWDSEQEVLICARDIDRHVQWVTAEEARRSELEKLDRAKRRAIEALQQTAPR